MTNTHKIRYAKTVFCIAGFLACLYFFPVITGVTVVVGILCGMLYDITQDSDGGL